jgi:hypothetical protein
VREALGLQKRLMYQARVTALARNIFSVGTERLARKIQRHYRRHLSHRKAVAEQIAADEARYQRLRVEQERLAVAEKQQRGGSHAGGKSWLNRLGMKSLQDRMVESRINKVRKEVEDGKPRRVPLGTRVLQAVTGEGNPFDDPYAKEAAVAAIYNHQTRSVQSRGVVEMKVTVGRDEHLTFEAEQKAKPGLPDRGPFELLNVDLSGDAKRHVYLWIQTGVGPWVWTSMEIVKAPPNHSNPSANKSRIFGLREAGYVVCGHSEVPSGIFLTPRPCTISAFCLFVCVQAGLGDSRLRPQVCGKLWPRTRQGANCAVRR